MTQTPPPATTLPHHKLFAYELCLSLVKLVAKTRIADAQLRAQARKSAASAALNCAEGAARQTRADKSRGSRARYPYQKYLEPPGALIGSRSPRGRALREAKKSLAFPALPASVAPAAEVVYIYITVMTRTQIYLGDAETLVLDR